MSYKDEHHHRKEELKYKKLGLFVNSFAAIAAAASAGAAILALRSAPAPAGRSPQPTGKTSNTPPQSSPSNKTAPSKQPNIVQPKTLETQKLPPIPLDSSLPEVETNTKNPVPSELPTKVEEKQSIPTTEKSAPKQKETAPSTEVKIEPKTQFESVEKKLPIPVIEFQSEKPQQTNEVNRGKLPSADNSTSTSTNKERSPEESLSTPNPNQ